MAKRKQASGGQKKKKPVTIAFIKDEPNSTPHNVLHDLIERHYPELEDAKIGLFWKYGWKAENDSGRIRLWHVAKASETLRAVTDFDLCIYLNADLWGKKGWKNEHQEFVIDSALAEIQADRDRDGDQKRDENGRDCWRLVKPTIQTFPQIVQRHGLATVEMQKLAQALAGHNDSKRPLFDWLNDQPVSSEQSAPEPEAAASAA